MNNYTWDYLHKHPQETKSLLGINYGQLEELIEQGKYQGKRILIFLKICYSKRLL